MKYIKYRKIEAQYRRYSQYRKCKDCHFYDKKPSSCYKVRGRVASNGTCRFFWRR